MKLKKIVGSALDTDILCENEVPLEIVHAYGSHVLEQLHKSMLEVVPDIAGQVTEFHVEIRAWTVSRQFIDPHQRQEDESGSDTQR
jgi:hypothetical protein